MIRRLLLGGVAAVVLAGAGQAADLPVGPGQAYYPGVVTPVPYYDWGGVYLGLNAGGSWVAQSQGVITNAPTGTFVSSSASSGSSGFAGGGQFGANWFIAPSFLLGVEADFDALTNRTSVTSSDGTNRHDGKLKFLSTARGRFGLTADRLLFYLTGGLASGENSVTRTQIAGTVNNAPPGTIETINKFRIGWVAGTGVEYAFLNNWTARVEYLYSRLDGVTYTFPLAQRTTQTPFEAINLIRVGVNYKFGGGDPYIRTRD